MMSPEDLERGRVVYDSRYGDGKVGVLTHIRITDGTHTVDLSSDVTVQGGAETVDVIAEALTSTDAATAIRDAVIRAVRDKA